MNLNIYEYLLTHHITGLSRNMNTMLYLNREYSNEKSEHGMSSYNFRSNNTYP